MDDDILGAGVGWYRKRSEAVVGIWGGSETQGAVKMICVHGSYDGAERFTKLGFHMYHVLSSSSS